MKCKNSFSSRGQNSANICGAVADLNIWPKHINVTLDHKTKLKAE